MPMPLNPPTDDQVRQQVLAQLLADATTRGGAQTAALIQPAQQAILGNVRMGDNEDAAWSGGYRNDEVAKGNAQMLALVAADMQAKRDQEAADKLALASGGGGGGRSGHGGSGGSAYQMPTGIPTPTLSALADSVGAGVIAAPPTIPARSTGAAIGPAVGLVPKGPTAVGLVPAAPPKAITGPQSSKKWMGW